MIDSIIEEILTRGVEQILPSKKGLENLINKKKIRLYMGIDPTSNKLHLGHTVGLRKLQQFADLGHDAILLFGTGTVLAGDPSKREEARKKIAAEQINHNIATWKKQVEPIIDFNVVSIMYNAEWLLQLTLKDIIEIASHISAVQLFKRDMFQKRLNKGDTIWTHEILYPMLQGYDSVAMDVDLEIGGTDQTFNMLMGRELQKKMNNKNKFVLSTPLILGTDGQMMSKTRKNCIWLTDSANEKYNKIMSINDSQIIPYMKVLTDIQTQDIDRMSKELKSKKDNPINVKKLLALNIVAQFHGEISAMNAQKEFENVFQSSGDPKHPRQISRSKNADLITTLVKNNIVDSKSEAKRLISQGAIDVNGRIVDDVNFKLKGGELIKVGKYTFVKAR